MLLPEVFFKRVLILRVGIRLLYLSLIFDPIFWPGWHERDTIRRIIALYTTETII